MNTPNKLTILRILFIPLLMVFLLYPLFPYVNIAALATFVLAFFTDLLDGYLARKNHQVTDFGKIADPLADKLLVTAALICLTANEVVSPWATIIILGREFLVSGIRTVAAAKGTIIAASKFGKVKTLWQFVALSIAIVSGANLVTDICIWLAVFLTVLSGIDYVMKNRKHLPMK